MVHYYLSEIARLIDKESSQELEITAFEQDSRKAGPGCLFFAFKGEKADGHDFLQDVAGQGARAAVVSQDYRGEDFGLVLIRVDDVMSALHCMARKMHASRHPRVIAVTGSVGKTTTKEFIATLLSENFRVAKTPGNANSQVSVPLSILNSPGDEEVFVIEMGMSERGEMKKLVSIAPPEISVVTNISYAHVVFFPEGIEGIAYEKAQILSHENTRLGVVSAQAAEFFLCVHTGICPKVIYGGAGDYVLECASGLKIMEKGVGSPLLDFPFQATHLRENFLAAVAVARAMGLSWTDIARRAPYLMTVSKRFEQIERDGVVFINDSYNANATSMKAALQNLPKAKVGRKTIAVLGAMKELGVYTESFHKEVAACALGYVDELLCLGEECQVMVDLFLQQEKKAELYPDLPTLKQKLFEMVQEGDIVLLKGSRSNRLWLLLE
jgi:UDP-N-acetylmuramoyl-tripeptide--D-alanyl-D-alanine ligase